MRLTRHTDITSIRQVAEVELAPGVSIEIQDVPPDYPERMEAELPMPKPKALGPLREDGRIVKEGGRPLLQYDDRDPEYLARVAEVNTLRNVFLVLHGTAPGQMEFEASQNGDAFAYHRAVLEEMKAFGFGIGQVTRIAQAVAELSGIGDDDVAVAREDFSEPAG